MLAAAKHRKARTPDGFVPQLKPQALAPAVAKILLAAHFFLPSLRRIVSLS
jgi:hypothetical protein